jgi:hypothetical protein
MTAATQSQAPRGIFVMEQRRVRLGDVIDDYCPRCRLVMNHGVVGMIDDDVKKVRCNTCLSEHQFRHGKLPARRRNEKGKLFEEVLKGIAKPAEAAKADAAAIPAEESRPSGDQEAGDAPAPLAGSQAPPAEPAHAQRRLYTIRRSMAGKPRDPRKS